MLNFTTLHHNLPRSAHRSTGRVLVWHRDHKSCHPENNCSVWRYNINKGLNNTAEFKYPMQCLQQPSHSFSGFTQALAAGVTWLVWFQVSNCHLWLTPHTSYCLAREPWLSPGSRAGLQQTAAPEGSVRRMQWTHLSFRASHSSWEAEVRYSMCHVNWFSLMVESRHLALMPAILGHTFIVEWQRRKISVSLAQWWGKKAKNNSNHNNVVITLTTEE